MSLDIDFTFFKKMSEMEGSLTEKQTKVWDQFVKVLPHLRSADGLIRTILQNNIVVSKRIPRVARNSTHLRDDTIEINDGSTKSVRFENVSCEVGRNHLSVSCTKIRCLDCDKLIKGNHNFRQHICIVRSPLSQNQYKCGNCDAPCGTLENYEKHVKKCKRNKPRGMFHCTECGKNFNNRLSLNYDVEKHRQKKANKLSIDCDRCGNMFQSQELFDDHVCDRAQKHICEDCGVHYNNYNNIRTHNCANNLKKKYICYKCCNRYASRILLLQHSAKCEGPIVCRKCRKEFSTKASLESHFIQCISEIKCEKCSQHFLSVRDYRKHMSESHNCHHGCYRCQSCVPEFKCPLCDKVLHTNVSHTLHMREVHANTQP